jgi:transposase-like protein
MAVLVLAGITLERRREILACEPMMNESVPIELSSTILRSKVWRRSCSVFPMSIKGSGRLFGKHSLVVSWQRCKVHFRVWGSFSLCHSNFGRGVVGYPAVSGLFLL